ncbi:MAG: NB-ARC domain-containing protein [Actinomycetota bacterium]|jgi:GNAT superfamily N-acetyltransferase|nr:NB-ARC domain-containing protein [Actinomycetota bacterium]MDA8301120.1 NB-ARC domain-containing protein [Actinomycetota bacterium]
MNVEEAPDRRALAERFYDCCKAAVDYHEDRWESWLEHESSALLETLYDESGSERCREAGEAMVGTARLARHLLSVTSCRAAETGDEWTVAAKEVASAWAAGPTGRLSVKLRDGNLLSLAAGGKNNAVLQGEPGLLRAIATMVAEAGRGTRLVLGSFAEALYDYCGIDPVRTFGLGNRVTIGCLLDAVGGGDIGTLEMTGMSGDLREVYPDPRLAFVVCDPAFYSSVERAVSAAVAGLGRRPVPPQSVRWTLFGVKRALLPVRAADLEEARLAGPSFAAPFGTGMLAILVGTALQAGGPIGAADKPTVCITGDVAGDGTLCEIGGCQGKLRAAGLAKAELILVPRENLQEWRACREELALGDPTVAQPQLRPASSLADALDKAWRHLHIPFVVTAPDVLFGREEELGWAMGQLDGDRVLVLFGKPGTGKTALGATIADHVEDSSGVVANVVRAGLGRSADPIVRSAVLGHWARALKLSPKSTGTGDEPLDQRYEIESHLVEEGERLLALVDDVEVGDAELVHNLFPRHHCVAIVTTTDPHLASALRGLGREVEELEVRDLPQDAAVKLLTRVASSGFSDVPLALSSELLTEVVRRTGSSPLEVVLAGASLREVVRLGEAACRRWLKTWKGAGVYAEEHLATTPHRAVASLSTRQREALGRLSILAPRPELFEEELAKNLLEGLEDCLPGLVARWVLFPEPRGRLSIHPLIAEQARSLAPGPDEAPTLHKKAASFYAEQLKRFLGAASFSALFGIEGPRARQYLRHFVHHLSEIGDPRAAAAAYLWAAVWAFWWFDYFVPWELVDDMVVLVPEGDDDLAEAAREVSVLRSSYVPESKWQQRSSGNWEGARRALQWMDEVLADALKDDVVVLEHDDLREARGMVGLLLADCAHFGPHRDHELALGLSTQAQTMFEPGSFNDWWSRYYMADAQVALGHGLDAFLLGRAAVRLARAAFEQGEDFDDEVLAHLERVMSEVATMERLYDVAEGCLCRALAHAMRFHFANQDPPDGYTTALHLMMTERLGTWLVERFRDDEESATTAAVRVSKYFRGEQGPSRGLVEGKLKLAATGEAEAFKDFVAVIASASPTREVLDKPGTDYLIKTKELVSVLFLRDPALEDPVGTWARMMSHTEPPPEGVLLFDLAQARVRDLLDEADQEVLGPSFPPEQYVSRASMDVAADEEDEGQEAACEEEGDWQVAVGPDGNVWGVVKVEHYPLSDAVLYAYVATRPGYRGIGIGRTLMHGATQQLASLPESVLAFIEIDMPGYHAVDEAYGDPVARLRFYERFGIKATDLHYFQPRLRVHLSRSYHMVLGVVPRAGSVLPAHISGERTRAFLEEYFVDCEGPGALEDEEVRRLLEQCKRPEIPLLPLTEEALRLIPGL